MSHLKTKSELCDEVRRCYYSGVWSKEMLLEYVQTNLDKYLSPDYVAEWVTNFWNECERNEATNNF